MVRIDARLRIKPREGRIQGLNLLFDRGLEPIAIPEGAISSTQQMPGNETLQILHFPQPLSADTPIDVSYAYDLPMHKEENVTDTKVQRVTLPHIDVEGSAELKEYWAASIDSAFDAADTHLPNFDIVPPSQFASLWGGDETKPQFAWTSRAGESAGEIIAKFRETKISARYALALIADSAQINLRLAATLAVEGAPIFHCRLSIPKTIQIDDVTVSDQNGTIASRWSRTDGDHVSVMLAAPAVGDIKVLIGGQLPSTMNSDFSIPDISVDGGVSEDFRVVVFRRADVLVQLGDLAGLRLAGPAELTAAVAEVQRENQIASAGDDVQFAAALLGAERYCPAILHLERNRPRVVTLQAITVNKIGGGWQAALNAHLQVADGRVDVLRFDLPPYWNGPFEITPALPSSVEDLPGTGHKQLIIRPQTPIDGAFQLHIVGPLTVNAGQRAAAPEVHLLGLPRPTQYVLLPRQMEDQQLSWDTRGLIPATLPEELLEIASSREQYRVFQYRGGQFRAVLRSSERNSESPQVRMADYRFSWYGDGRWYGVASFDFDSGSASNCVLELPENCELLNMVLDGLPALRTRAGEHRWNVWLGENKLPRHLAAIFCGSSLNGFGKAVNLPVPRLIDFPVERTLWSISSPVSFGPGLTTSGSSISEENFELIRLQTFAALVDSAAGLLAELSPASAQNWITPWVSRYAASSTFLRILERASGTEREGQSNDLLSASDQEFLSIVQRIGAIEIFNRIMKQPGVASEPSQVWRVTQDAERDITYAVGRGKQSQLRIDYVNSSRQSEWERVLIAMLLLLISITLIFRSRFRRWALVLLARRPVSSLG